MPQGIMNDYRITFSKTGSLSFISHLDFNHSFIRILKRARLPLRYSEGFNPRPKLVFGLPLSVGMEGINELADISLTEELSCEEVQARLTAAVPSELVIKSVCPPGVKLKYIEKAEYEVFFPELTLDVAAVGKVLEAPPPVPKHTKSGEKLTDISPMLCAHRVEHTEKGTILHLTLTAYDSMYLKPDYVVASLNEAGLALPDDYSVVRTHILFKDVNP